MLEVEGSWEMGQEKVPNAARGKLCKAEQPLVLNQTAPCYQEEEEEPSQEHSSFGLGRWPAAGAEREPAEGKEGNRLLDL